MENHFGRFMHTLPATFAGEVSVFPDAFGFDGSEGYNTFVALLTTAFTFSYFGTSVALGVINYVGNTEYVDEAAVSASGLQLVRKLEVWIRVITLSPLLVT